MSSLIESSVIRVMKANGETVGTGFVVKNDLEHGVNLGRPAPDLFKTI